MRTAIQDGRKGFASATMYFSLSDKESSPVRGEWETTTGICYFAAIRPPQCYGYKFTAGCSALERQCSC